MIGFILSRLTNGHGLRKARGRQNTGHGSNLCRWVGLHAETAKVNTDDKHQSSKKKFLLIEILPPKKRVLLYQIPELELASFFTVSWWAWALLLSMKFNILNWTTSWKHKK